MQMVEVADTALISELGASPAISEVYRDGIPTFWAHREQVHGILAFLKERAPSPYKMLYDLTAIDERTRTHRINEPTRDFTVVYHLFSFARNEYIRLKTALDQEALSVDTITDLWPAANWYEREVWDMFGITFSGHPHLTRILMPPTWEGYPLRKDHPA
jgi:NADH-quinone oxidoreductase subunit C/D